MMHRGFWAVRVRCHDDLVRIEVDNKDRAKLFNEKLFCEIADRLKKSPLSI